MRVLLYALLFIGVCSGLYSEELIVKPLPNQHVLTSFKFKLQSESYDASSGGSVTHYGSFPRSLPPILQTTDTKELHLRFSQGWYDSEVWGKLPYDGFKSGGTGVELWAILSSDTKETLNRHWLTLTNSLSALFCASLNFVGNANTNYPKRSFQSSNDILIPNNESLYLLRSSLPREPVCTENLTPFLKLIPAKGKAGISSLLDGHKVFDAQWNSMSIDIVTKYNEDGTYFYDMDLNIDLIMNVPKKLEINKNPIIKPIPGNELVCDETKKHDLYHCFPLMGRTDLEINLKALFGKDISGGVPFGNNPSRVTVVADPEFWEIKSFVVMSEGHAGEVSQSTVSGYEVRYNLDEQKPYNFVLKTKDSSKVVQVEQPPLMAYRSLTGYSQDSGGLRTIFQNNGEKDVEVIYFESLPWFLRLYLSSLKVSGATLTETYYVPSKDRTRPSHLELSLSVPANSTAVISYEFDKSLLLIAEYPPDANHGFDIEPAVISILEKGEEKYQFRTTSLLVTLPTPDFSMPYNVIILTGTVTSLVFGAIFQLLLKRVLTVEEAETLTTQSKVLNKLTSRINAAKSRLADLLVFFYGRILKPSVDAKLERVKKLKERSHGESTHEEKTK